MARALAPVLWARMYDVLYAPRCLVTPPCSPKAAVMCRPNTSERRCCLAISARCCMLALRLLVSL